MEAEATKKRMMTRKKMRTSRELDRALSPGAQLTELQSSQIQPSKRKATGDTGEGFRISC
jgi:hypothetical protein